MEGIINLESVFEDEQETQEATQLSCYNFEKAAI